MFFLIGARYLSIKAYMFFLCSKGVALQKEIREDEQEISTKSDNLSQAQEKYQNMFSAMQFKVDDIEVIIQLEIMKQKICS